MRHPDPEGSRDQWLRVDQVQAEKSRRAAAGRAQLLAKGGSIGQMQTLAELVPIPESSVKALESWKAPESCCILEKSRKNLVNI